MCSLKNLHVCARIIGSAWRKVRMCNCHLFFTIQGCKDPKALGFEEGIIKDSQITSSSIFSLEYAAKYGRLIFQGQDGRNAAWSALRNNDEQWLQVDLQYQVVLTGISSQGKTNCECKQWVKSYTVSCSNNGTYFNDFKQNGDIKVWILMFFFYVSWAKKQMIVEPNYSIYRQRRFLKQIVFKMSVIYPRLKSRKKYFLYLQNIF